MVIVVYYVHEGNENRFFPLFLPFFSFALSILYIFLSLSRHLLLIFQGIDCVFACAYPRLHTIISQEVILQSHTIQSTILHRQATKKRVKWMFLSPHSVQPRKNTCNSYLMLMSFRSLIKCWFFIAIALCFLMVLLLFRTLFIKATEWFPNAQKKGKKNFNLLNRSQCQDHYMLCIRINAK